MSNGGRPNGYTAAQFIAAIPKTGGIVSTIAAKVGCHWHTAKKYIDTMPTVKAAYDAECERVLDMAEGVILKSIEASNTQDAKWYLTRKGKGRGYIERQEQDIKGKLQLEYVNDWRQPED